jgi:NADH-quinone oxidoreductase subunit D
MTTSGSRFTSIGVTMVERLRIAIGPVRHLGADHVIELDSRHPISHGGFQLDVTVDAGNITSAEPRIGFLHRSAEKLFESRDYRQIMMLANRHDWHSSIHGELVIARAVEDAIGLVPPKRAAISRVLLAEVNRINVCLMFLGCAVARPRRDFTLQYREQLLTWYQSVAGSRIHPMINRVGGLAHPITATALDELATFLAGIEAHLPTLRADIDEATTNIGTLAVISSADVQQFGLSGPIARAAGVDTDLRSTDPNYEAFPLPTAKLGDGSLAARYRALLDDIASSLSIARQASTRLRDLGQAPIDVPLPKVVRVPEGTTYTWIEGPLGRTGALLVSVGDKLPWRLKLVTPSFHTMQSLSRVLIGTPLRDLGSVLASIFVVIGDADR